MIYDSAVLVSMEERVCMWHNKKALFMVDYADNSNAFRSPPRPVGLLVFSVCAGVCYLNFSTAITRSSYRGWFQAKLEERGTRLSAVLS